MSFKNLISFCIIFVMIFELTKGDTIGSNVSVEYQVEAEQGLNTSDPATLTLKSANLNFNMYPDWLKDVPDSLSIGQITLPGTHQTMALFGGGLAACQTLSLVQQLNSGIRVLDIRCRHIENTCAIHHGIAFQRAFLGDVLNTCIRFLQAHPSEALLMRLKEEYTPQDNTRSFPDTIESYLTTPKFEAYIWKGGNRMPKLGEIRNKIVIIDQITRGGYFGLAWFRCGSCAVPCSTDCIQDMYTVSTILPGAINTKWEHIVRHFAKSNAGSPLHLYINFLSGSSTFAHPSDVAARINARFIEHLSQETLNYKNLGTLLMDFPLAEQIGQIIDINFQAVSVLSVKFFDHDREGGQSKIFSIRQSSCINLGRWNKIPSSVKFLVGSSCVRLRENLNCSGESKRLVEGEGCATAFSRCGWQDRASSISQC